MSARNCGPSFNSDSHLHLRAGGEQPVPTYPLWLTINAQPATLARLDWVIQKLTAGLRAAVDTRRKGNAKLEGAPR